MWHSREAGVLVLAVPPTSCVSLSQGAPLPCFFIYKHEGTAPEDLFLIQSLAFPARSLPCTGIIGFSQKNYSKILIQAETSCISPLSLTLSYLPFSPKPSVLFQVLQCCFSGCPWLCLPLSPIPRAYCNVNLRENWVTRIVNACIEAEQVNNTSMERYLRYLPLR